MAYDRMDEHRKVEAPQYARLKKWSERRPCVALMGEFSAGKSTLLNFLIEENLLPTRATATELPPVWFSHGTGGSHWVDENGVSHPLVNADIRKVPMTARFIRIYAEAEILEHCDIIDTPGISDPNLAVESWRFAAGQANMVLWCTSATQAWRETERGAWSSLPERLRKHSMLVVTRADKLLTDADREKVARRMKRETSEFFNASLFMATPDAVRAKAELAEDDASPLWVSSGAEALLDKLAERFEAIYEERGALLSRYEIVGEGAIRARRPEDIRPEVNASDRTVEALRDRRAPYAEDEEDGPYRLEEGERARDVSGAASGAVPRRPTRPDRYAPAARPARPSAEAAAELRARLQGKLEEVSAEPEAVEPVAEESEDQDIDRDEVVAADETVEMKDDGTDRDTDVADAVESADAGEQDDLVIGAADDVSDDDAVVNVETDTDDEMAADEPEEAVGSGADLADAAVADDAEVSKEDEDLRAALGDDDNYEADEAAAADEDETKAAEGEGEDEAIALAEEPEAEAAEAEVAASAEVADFALERPGSTIVGPRELHVWHQVLARHPEAAENVAFIALIEDFLSELYGKTEAEGDSQETGLLHEAEDDAEAQPENVDTAPSWRRLA